MRFNGAIVKTAEKTVAIAVVEASFFAMPQNEKLAMMRKYAASLRNNPTIFMAEDADGNPQFYGRPDLINAVSDIPLTYMTWKEYEIKEDE